MLCKAITQEFKIICIQDFSLLHFEHIDELLYCAILNEQKFKMNKEDWKYFSMFLNFSLLAVPSLQVQ